MNFYAPKSYGELMNLLNSELPSTYFIAGGTDLIISLRNKKITEYNIIDLTKIKEWHSIEEDDENIYMGALCTMTEICANETIERDFKAIYRAAYELGSETIRNKATIGGNIGHASQSADVVLALFALNAHVEISGSDGVSKTIPISEVILGRNKTCLKKDEVISKIIIRKNQGISVFKKVGSRKAVVISKVSCAALLYVVDEVVKDANIYLGAVGEKATKARLLEDIFVGKKLQDVNSLELQNAAYEEIELAIPDRDSKYYKRVAVEGLVEDILKELKNYE